MSVNRLVSFAILAIGLLAAVLGGYIELTKLNSMRQLAASAVRLDVIRALGNIPRYLNSERGLAMVDLQTVASGDPSRLAELVEFRKPTDAAIAEAESRIAASRSRLDDGDAIVAEMTEVSRLFKQYRVFVEEKLALPIDQRGDVVGAMVDSGKAVNTIVSKASSEQLRRLAGDGEAFRNVNFADQVWALRDVGGRQSTAYLALVTARKPASLEARQEIVTLEGRVQQIWASLSQLMGESTTPAPIKAALSELKSSYFGAFAETKQKATAAFDSGDFPFDAAGWRHTSLPVWATLMAAREAFYDVAAAEIGDARSTAALEAIVAGLVLLGALGVAGAVLAIVRRRVTAPIAAMTQVMGRIAHGDFNVAIPGAGRTDEIGEMSNAVVVFRDAALAKTARDREIEAVRKQGEEARRRGEAETIERERSLVIKSIGAGLARLAAQDLAYRMNDDLPEAYRRLQEDFNTAIQQLDAALTGVAGNVHVMEAGSNQIATASDNLSQRTEQQAASLEETAGALQTITVTVEKTAGGAKIANTMVAAAKGDAEKGGQIVRAAIEAMAGIEQSSRQISQIVGVIDEIAFQTNLLALNAGVEAARAGDAGRGFAVVASEVRALAQRSAEAAKEIKGLVSASTSRVDLGVSLAADSGKALERIVTQISEVSRVVSEIAADAIEQASSVKEVNVAVSEMDQVTQRNAAMVEETTAASHNLLKEASLLLDSLRRFRVSGGETSATIGRTRRAA